MTIAHRECGVLAKPFKTCRSSRSPAAGIGVRLMLCNVVMSAAALEGKREMRSQVRRIKSERIVALRIRRAKIAGSDWPRLHERTLIQATGILPQTESVDPRAGARLRICVGHAGRLVVAGEMEKSEPT